MLLGHAALKILVRLREIGYESTCSSEFDQFKLYNTTDVRSGQKGKAVLPCRHPCLPGKNQIDT